jgi:hypothetical protein
MRHADPQLLLLLLCHAAGSGMRTPHRHRQTDR